MTADERAEYRKMALHLADKLSSSPTEGLLRQLVAALDAAEVERDEHMASVRALNDEADVLKTERGEAIARAEAAAVLLRESRTEIAAWFRAELDPRETSDLVNLIDAHLAAKGE